MRRRWVQWLIILVGISLMVNLSRDILRWVKVRDQVRLAQAALDQARQENKELMAQKDYYTSEEFAEEQARNKLNMAKEGESVVILPDDLGKITKQTDSFQKTPIWKQWWELFF